MCYSIHNLCTYLFIVIKLLFSNENYFIVYLLVFICIFSYCSHSYNALLIADYNNNIQHEISLISKSKR